MYPDKLGRPWPTSQEWERGSSREGIGRRGGIERVSVWGGVQQGWEGVGTEGTDKGKVMNEWEKGGRCSITYHVT